MYITSLTLDAILMCPRCGRPGSFFSPATASDRSLCDLSVVRGVTRTVTSCCASTVVCCCCVAGMNMLIDGPTQEVITVTYWRFDSLVQRMRGIACLK